MPRPKPQTFSLSTHWSIEQLGSSLIVSGGADARFEIELEADEPSFFASVNSDKAFTREQLGARDQQVLEELLTAEIVVPVLSTPPDPRFAVIGDKNTLGLYLGNKPSNADFLLIVRTQSTYAALLKDIDYQQITKPHLFLDMTFHHTISVGPLVFPGETACIACLQGRVSTRWADETPPEKPRVTTVYSNLAAELVRTELDKIAASDTSLVNKTISWNFQDRSVSDNQLLKVPLCPICTQRQNGYTGSIVLPWDKR